LSAPSFFDKSLCVRVLDAAGAPQAPKVKGAAWMVLTLRKPIIVADVAISSIVVAIIMIATRDLFL
jgi:hypothetical protein